MWRVKSVRFDSEHLHMMSGMAQQKFNLPPSPETPRLLLKQCLETFPQDFQTEHVSFSIEVRFLSCEIFKVPDTKRTGTSFGADIYSLFTLRKPRSPLILDGERGFLRANRHLINYDDDWWECDEAIHGGRDVNQVGGCCDVVWYGILLISLLIIDIWVLLDMIYRLG